MNARGKRTQTAVLSVLRAHRGALSAYEVLAMLRQTHPTISAPTIYRALAALTELGRVHRLETLNAFIAAKHGGDHRASILSICDDCGTVEESVSPALLAELSRIARRSGFSTSRHVVEIHGRCASCSDGAARA